MEKNQNVGTKSAFIPILYVIDINIVDLIYCSFCLILSYV